MEFDLMVVSKGWKGQLDADGVSGMSYVNRGAKSLTSASSSSDPGIMLWII